MNRVVLTIMPQGRALKAEPGTGLLENLRAILGEDFESPCGGAGLCGKCQVMIQCGEIWVSALACQTRVDRNMTVLLPDGSLGQEQILRQGAVSEKYALEPTIRKMLLDTVNRSKAGDGYRSQMDWLVDQVGKVGREKECDPGLARQLADLLQSGSAFITAVVYNDQIVSLEPGDTREILFGMAFDIGTTTLVGYLLNLNTGTRIATVSAMNPQRTYGADVISRVNHTNTLPDGLEQLTKAIRGGVERLIDQAAEMAGLRRTDIYELVFVGNTCMNHLFLGIHPAGLGQAPYKPVLRAPVCCLASSLGLTINSAGFVYWLPNVSGFIGSDTIGALLSNPVDQDETARLVVDIGTNGEMAIGVGGQIWACSTSAGPAFEGACIKNGMRAMPGAIDAVQVVGEDINYHIIGSYEPKGLCGSGLVDAVAGFLKTGVIDITGRFQSDNLTSWPETLKERVVPWQGSHAFILALQEGKGEPIMITQKDIRQVQLAKGAIAAGIEIIVKEAGLRLEEIGELYVAGAFGNYLDKHNMCAIGLLPLALENAIIPVGNAAGEGAVLALLSASARHEAFNIAGRVRYIELAGRSDFQDIFVEAMTFPASMSFDLL
ncbi:ASKHA domain-containing protein [Acetonema longum]|uniref:Ferredoxin n=1 Tax=Acetonema longum DSM 6540 TaxID=1009370 RepID=F7NLT1_9FIRM|nr:ASKHA domain-containing protein [Acetonema longum]EGO63022.1 ferredoxin [Acetonema longum DSM 6540]